MKKNRTFFKRDGAQERVHHRPAKHGIAIKKQFGQHFLKDEEYVERIFDHVDLNQTSSVFEIGCGEGILTSAILKRPVKKVWVFEIDQEWARFVQEKYGSDSRLEIFLENILDVDLSRLAQDAPWTLLANLPYNITFPILHLLVKNRAHVKEGVIMIQEEVAQKIMQTSGRGYGYPSLYFQYYFDWKKLDKVPPTAFFPPPKVFSRFLWFRPKQNVSEIPQADLFWKFIKYCFSQPRRTLKNNLQSTHYKIDRLSEDLLKKRAQELSMSDFLSIWNLLQSE
jgi:16S rRNA (adenine1518-N6/adenine1519-N6)-dimethyltransferase